MTDLSYDNLFVSITMNTILHFYRILKSLLGSRSSRLKFTAFSQSHSFVKQKLPYYRKLKCAETTTNTLESDAAPYNPRVHVVLYSIIVLEFFIVVNSRFSVVTVVKVNVTLLWGKNKSAK